MTSSREKTSIILLLSAFSILLDKQSAEIIKIPLINLDLDVKTIQIIIPLILSIIYWEYLGSMRAASIAIKNIQFRLNNLKFKDQEFHLFDVVTSLYLLDLICFNF